MGELRTKKTKYICILFAFVLLSELLWSRGLDASLLPPGQTEGNVTEVVVPPSETTTQDVQRQDSLKRQALLNSSLEEEGAPQDTALNLVIDSLAQDSSKRVKMAPKPFLDDIIVGKNKDSLVYDMNHKRVYIFEKGEIQFLDKTLKADYMQIDMEKREVYAHGRPDSTDMTEEERQEILNNALRKIRSTRPEFIDGASTYTMDTITYNLRSEKARIKGVATQEGEGYITGERVKKMPDNTINIAHGRYTTCDADHPHFFLAMTRAKTIPNKKSVFGPSYVVMEDVPVYFLGLPFGFFPMTSGRKSGFLIPSYGEEQIKGFFLRDGGYYFALNDYVDLALTGGIYTLGSWETRAESRYIKRYRHSGSMNLEFNNNVIGEKGEDIYQKSKDFRVAWSHSQDAKFRPNSRLAASVNFATSTYSKFANNMNDYLNTQTNSSISYDQTFAGTPFSLSTNIQHSQNSRDSTHQLSFPNMVLNATRINPLKRKDAIGKERWYEKISFTYNGMLGNTVTVKEKDLFTDKMYDNMRNGVIHKIPVMTSMNVMKYLNVSPNVNYTERWYIQKINKHWDPVKEQIQNDTTQGFYRVYDYSFGVGTTTKIYGTYQFKKGAAIQAIRHMLTPQVRFNYTPDFGAPRFGYYREVQSSVDGTMMTYSPFESNLYGVPGKNASANIGFGLQQNLEMKVRSGQDSTGVRKIKVIDDFGIAGTYNLLADSMNLSPFSLILRTQIIKNIGLTVNATLDPYQINEKGQRINQFTWRKGSIGRLTNVVTSFGYTFNSSKSGRPAVNDINSGAGSALDQQEMFGESKAGMDANTRRQLMSSAYYDFDIPWNLGLNYSFNYTKPGHVASVIQTLGFNGSVTLTEKWGISFNGGYDFKARTITPGTITIARDLHCWQMNVIWVPVGFRKSWSFNISVKASTLRDLKYDRRSSFIDTFYGN